MSPDSTVLRSAIASAIDVAHEARLSALSAGSFGTAFDLLVVGDLLNEDRQVHGEIVAGSKSIAQRLGDIIADGRVTAEEIKEIGHIIADLIRLETIARPE